MLYKISLTIIFLSLNLFANIINIAVAANVSYAIEPLKKKFNRLYPDIQAQITIGSSGKLTAQITHGAPYDLFLSANMDYPQALYDQNKTITKPIVYAKGLLALLSSKNRDFSRALEVLKDKNISKIAVANPKTAPYGKATAQALEKAGISDMIRGKFVYGESIAQTLTYTVKACDIGFVAKSLLYSPKMKRYKKDINWIEVDETLYTPISQGLVILSHAKDNPSAKLFYDFLLGENARNILRDYGYLLP